ncbi:hypothetical protein ES319_D08G009000v1 [Gossypium barbadense]|uniref:Uncharacterized protein n=1 Tax=Gossypium barbadense TaxID=3634 RepID=A0A5J5Q9P6_GOSBA|nr:hypothetical protein ES319_D08G009000v1 [Gossypium barbadense]
MKGSIRPLLSILMLVVLATTLTFRIFIYGRRVFTVAATQQPSPIQTFNSTLLNFAAIDIGEEKSKLEIDQLLERNYDNERRTTGYTTWRRFNHYDANAKAKSKRDNKLLGGESCSCDPYGPNVPIVMYICQPVHFADYVMCNSSHEAPMLVTDPRFDVLCARIVKYYSVKRFVEEMGKTLDEWGPVHDGSLFHYSSGFQAVMLALGICDKVGMFGFGKSASTAHHYHTNQKAELRLHDYEAEYEFYHDLVKNPRAIPFVSDKFRFPPVVIYR